MVSSFLSSGSISSGPGYDSDLPTLLVALHDIDSLCLALHRVGNMGFCRRISAFVFDIRHTPADSHSAPAFFEMAIPRSYCSDAPDFALIVVRRTPSTARACRRGWENEARRIDASRARSLDRRLDAYRIALLAGMQWSRWPGTIRRRMLGVYYP